MHHIHRFGLCSIFIEHFTQPFSEKLLNEGWVREFDDRETYVFTEWDFYFNKDLVFRGGLRGGTSAVSGEEWLDPRFSIAYQLKDASQLSFAAGRFHQLPVENFRVLNTDLKNAESNHLILNYLFTKEGFTFRAETFYNSYDQLVTFTGSLENPQGLQNGGSGYAKGMDFFFRDRKTFKDTDYWITYSFVDSKRSLTNIKRKFSQALLRSIIFRWWSSIWSYYSNHSSKLHSLTMTVIHANRGL